MKLSIASVLLSTSILIASCKKTTSDNNPNAGGGSGGGNGGGGGGNTGALTISSTVPEYVFWGDELTINGTGFSANKADNFVWLAGNSGCGSSGNNDSTGWRKAEVTAASATQLKIKIPYAILQQSLGDRPCGDDYGDIHVTVNGKTAIAPNIKLLKIPALYSFTNTSSPEAIRPGFDALLDVDLGGYLKSAGLLGKVKISAGGKLLDAQLYDTARQEYRFTLAPAEFVLMQCTPDPWFGEPGRMVPFKIYIEGSNKESTRNYFVYNLHHNYEANNAGSFTFSKTTSFNPQIEVTGKHMFFSKARFASTNGACPTVTMNISSCTGCSKQTIGVPLSQLNANCNYSVSLEDDCGRLKAVASVKINP